MGGEGGLVFPTWLLAFATIVLALATIGLFIYTAKLWSATKTLVGDEQSNTKRELRAYISVEPAGINALIGSTKAIGLVIVRNVGKIPANNVEVIVRMSLIADKSIDTSDPGTPPASDRTIQPGSAMQQGSDETVAAPDIVRGSGDMYVYVWGVVRYGDGFVPDRRTWFCHRYDCASHVHTENWVSPSYVTRAVIKAEKARYHTSGNVAD
jgi:hypothetical protein